MGQAQSTSNSGKSQPTQSGRRRNAEYIDRDDRYRHSDTGESVLELDSDVSIISNNNSKDKRLLPNSNVDKELIVNENSSLNNSNHYINSLFANNHIEVTASPTTTTGTVSSEETVGSRDSGGGGGIGGIPKLRVAAAAAAAAASVTACRSSTQQLLADRYLTDRHLQQNHHHQRLGTPRRQRRLLIHSQRGCDPPHHFQSGLTEQCHLLFSHDKPTIEAAKDRRTAKTRGSTSSSSGGGSDSTTGIQWGERRDNSEVELPTAFCLEIRNNGMMAMRSDLEAETQQQKQESPIAPEVSSPPQESLSPGLGSSVSAASTIIPATIRSQIQKQQQEQQQQEQQQQEQQQQQQQQQQSGDTSLEDEANVSAAGLKDFLGDQMRRLAEESCRQYVATAVAARKSKPARVGRLI